MKSIYEEITDKLIAMMEKGIIPWTKPWVCGGGIVSYATGKPYSLLNRMLLDRPGAYVTFHRSRKQVAKSARAPRPGRYTSISLQSSRHPRKLTGKPL